MRAKEWWAARVELARRAFAEFGRFGEGPGEHEMHLALDRTIRRLRALSDGYKKLWKAACEMRDRHELNEAKAWRRYRELKASMRAYRTPRPRADWGEEDGPVLWWKLPVCEPPWAGGANDDDFPDYVTHWTPILDLDEP